VLESVVGTGGSAQYREMISSLYLTRQLSENPPVPVHDGRNRKYSLVFIHGAGHCGSTLLNLILNASEEAVGLSEIDNLHRFFVSAYPRERGATERRNSRFWQGVFAEYRKRFGRDLLADSAYLKVSSWNDYLSMTEADRQTIYSLNRGLFDCIAVVSGCRVLCDASKFLIRAHLLISAGLPVKVIHLQRDGRAVLASYVKKGKDPGASLKRWRNAELGYFFLNRWLPSGDLMYCRYERLARTPEPVIKELCNWLEIAFNDRMLDGFMQVPHHGIGGNRMQHGGASKVVHDNAWKKRLPARTRAAFWLKGGWIQLAVRASAVKPGGAP